MWRERHGKRRWRIGKRLKRHFDFGRVAVRPRNFVRAHALIDFRKVVVEAEFRPSRARYAGFGDQ